MTSSTGPGDLRDRYEEIITAFQSISLLSLRESATLEEVLRETGDRLIELLGLGRYSVFMRRSDGRFQGFLGYSRSRGPLDTSVRRLIAGGVRDRYTSEIVDGRTPVLITDAARDPRHTQRTVRTFRVTDTMGIPLVVEGEVIGIIFVDDEGRRHAFTAQMAEVAQAFAGLAALAVWQRWMFQRLAERTRAITEQRQAADRSRAVHDRVMRVILDDRPVVEVLAELSALLRRTVVQYDPQLCSIRSVAVDGTVDTTQRPPDPFLLEAAEELESGEVSSVERRVNPSAQQWRLLVRLVAGQGPCLGYLALRTGGGRFTAIDSQALEQAGLALSLKISSERRRAEAYEHERQQFLADIVHRRRAPEVLADRAALFAIDPARRHAILLLRRPQSEPLPHRALAEEPVRELVAAATGSQLLVVASTGMPGADVFLLAVATEAGTLEPGTLRRLLDTVFEEVRATFAVDHMVVSAPEASLTDLPDAYAEVQETVALLDELDAPAQWAFARDLLAMRLVVQRGGFAGAAQQAQRFLQPLHRYDAVNGSTLLETLRAYIDSGAQIRGAAAALGVHENTVRYRLGRIREVSSFDPERIEDLAGASIALRVAGLAENGRT